MYKAYNEQDFVDVADAIREKTGKSAKLEFPDEFISEIEDISGGGQIDYDVLNPSVETDGVSTRTFISTSIKSPGQGGKAPSGTTQIIYLMNPVDLTNINSVVFSLLDVSKETNTSDGMRVGVSQSIPQDWTDVTNARTKSFAVTGEVVVNTSDLSGNYYLFYAANLTYNQYGWCIATIGFPIL